MNIGVFTHCVADNYGANLQSYSTARYLANRGYTPIFINWAPYPPNNNETQVKLHSSFLSRYGFKVTEPCVSDNDFVEVIKKYEIKFLIVGSDCVLTYRKPFVPWILTRKGIKRIKIAKDFMFPNPFWLPFFNQIAGLKAVMMSGSCGCSDLNRASGEIRKQMKGCLDRFSYISVRDDYTKNSLYRILGKEAAERIPITPDPVFAFNQNCMPIPSKEEILEKFNLPENYIATNFYAEFLPKTDWLYNLKKEINRVGYKLVNLPMPQDINRYPSDIDIPLPLDSLDWYCIIKYSSGYVGNNMHPIIVSIHNSVPFYSIDAHGKYYLRRKIQDVSHTKEYELLKRFGLLDYHISNKKLYSITPHSIVERLLAFDKEYCTKCSDILKSEYFAMMDTIVGNINKQV